MTTRYQAKAHVNTGEYQYWNPIGQPVHSEAAAWLEVHNIALHFWPEDSGRRRSFESHCKVDPVQVVEIA